MGWSWMAALTLSSTSQVKVAMRHEDGRMVSGSPTSLSSSWNCRDKASGLTLWDPGRYEREKFNLVRKSDHRAWREFSLLADWMYSRFV